MMELVRKHYKCGQVATHLTAIGLLAMDVATAVVWDTEMGGTGGTGGRRPPPPPPAIPPIPLMMAPMTAGATCPITAGIIISALTRIRVKNGKKNTNKLTQIYQTAIKKNLHTEADLYPGNVLVSSAKISRKQTPNTMQAVNLKICIFFSNFTIQSHRSPRDGNDSHRSQPTE